MEEYLGDQDKLSIRLHYTDIKKQLRTEELLEQLNDSGLFSEEDDHFFREYKTQDRDITEYFIFNILLQRATYGHLQELREILRQIQPEVLRYFQEVHSEQPEENSEEPNNNEPKATEEDVVDYTLAVAGDSRTRSSQPENHHPAADIEEETVQKADEPDGMGRKSFLRSIKRRLSFKKKKKSKTSEASDEASAGNHVTQTGQVSVATQVSEDEQTLRPAGFKQRLFPQNQKKKIKRISRFTDAFLEYGFKDNAKPFGKGMCLVFSLFTEDLPGYVHDERNLKEYFKSIQYEVRSGPEYTNITRQELFDRINEVTAYMDQQRVFDRLVVVVLTHGKKDGLLTCADRNGFIEEQQQVKRPQDGKIYHVAVKTTIEEIVDNFKHDKLESLKDMPKLFLVQACRGQGVVKAAHKSRDPGLDEVDSTDLDISQLQFNTLTPIDGDILVCYATTENHSSLVNPYTGSWFIQKTIEVFRTHLTREHVVDMMTVVHLAVSECRGVVNKNKPDEYRALQIPSMVSSLRKKFFLYNSRAASSLNDTEGCHGISAPIDARLPTQFVQNEERQPLYRQIPTPQPISVQYQSQPNVPPGVSQQYLVYHDRQPETGLNPRPVAPYRQSPDMNYQRQPGPDQSSVYSQGPPEQHLPAINQKPLYNMGNSSRMPVQPLILYQSGSPGQVHSNCVSSEAKAPGQGQTNCVSSEAKAPLASTEN